MCMCVYNYTYTYMYMCITHIYYTSYTYNIYVIHTHIHVPVIKLLGKHSSLVAWYSSHPSSERLLSQWTDIDTESVENQ